MASSDGYTRLVVPVTSWVRSTIPVGSVEDIMGCRELGRKWVTLRPPVFCASLRSQSFECRLSRDAILHPLSCDLNK